MNDWFVYRFPRVAIALSIFLWIVRNAGWLFSSPECVRAVQIIVIWGLYPVCIIWCIFSVRWSRATGAIALVPGVRSSIVQKAKDPMAFAIGVGAYWIATIAAIFSLVILTIK